jgi:hypothetical protein
MFRHTTLAGLGGGSAPHQEDQLGDGPGGGHDHHHEHDEFGHVPSLKTQRGPASRVRAAQRTHVQSYGGAQESQRGAVMSPGPEAASLVSVPLGVHAHRIFLSALTFPPTMPHRPCMNPHARAESVWYRVAWLLRRKELAIDIIEVEIRSAQHEGPPRGGETRAERRSHRDRARAPGTRGTDDQAERMKNTHDSASIQRIKSVFIGAPVNAELIRQ